jgi:hypothetical protein
MRVYSTDQEYLNIHSKNLDYNPAAYVETYNNVMFSNVCDVLLKTKLISQTSCE